MSNPAFEGDQIIFARVSRRKGPAPPPPYNATSNANQSESSSSSTSRVPFNQIDLHKIHENKINSIDDISSCSTSISSNMNIESSWSNDKGIDSAEITDDTKSKFREKNINFATDNLDSSIMNSESALTRNHPHSIITGLEANHIDSNVETKL